MGLAGLPSLLRILAEAKSYSERVFSFHTIDNLTVPLAAELLTAPAGSEPVAWDDAAVERVVSQASGYPYFLQQFGQDSWNDAAGPDITLTDARVGAESGSGDVATRLDRKITSLGPTRANLIAKGLVYAPEHGVIAFPSPAWPTSSVASPTGRRQAVAGAPSASRCPATRTAWGPRVATCGPRRLRHGERRSRHPYSHPNNGVTTRPRPSHAVRTETQDTAPDQPQCACKPRAATTWAGSSLPYNRQVVGSSPTIGSRSP